MSESSGKQTSILKSLNQMQILPMFAIIILSNVLVGGLIGYFLDRCTFKNKVLFIIFLAAGIVSGLNQGIRELLKEARKIEEDEKRKQQEQQASPDSDTADK